MPIISLATSITWPPDPPAHPPWPPPPPSVSDPAVPPPPPPPPPIAPAAGYREGIEVAVVKKSFIAIIYVKSELVILILPSVDALPDLTALSPSVVPPPKPPRAPLLVV